MNNKLTKENILSLLQSNNEDLINLINETWKYRENKKHLYPDSTNLILPLFQNSYLFLSIVLPDHFPQTRNISPEASSIFLPAI